MKFSVISRKPLYGGGGGGGSEGGGITPLLGIQLVLTGRFNIYGLQLFTTQNW